MKASVSQWIGHRREQEDTYRVQFLPEGLLAVVCDGMGGHHQGKLAAEQAVETFVDTFKHVSASWENRLKEALLAANHAVGRLVEKTAQFGGTTLVAAFVGGGLVRWISVGDSALMLWRRGRLIRLNADHSMRPLLEKVVPGETSASHILRSALTGEPLSLIDTPALPLPLLPDDRLILCSDGAGTVLNPVNVSAALRKCLDSPAENIASSLIELVCQSAGSDADNATVLLVDM